ncbi:MAG: hypothetical protein E7311_03550 [Clostridiales bacterium]|nr:hypothetical protein [Clostridiales bacterium]
MKTYGSISSMRLLDIRVILNDTETIYDGMTEDLPSHIKEMKYSKIEMTDKMELYVYDTDK